MIMNLNLLFNYTLAYLLFLVIVSPVFISLEKVGPSISVLQCTAEIVRYSFPVSGYWLWVGIINSFWVKPPILRTFKMCQVSCCLVLAAEVIKYLPLKK